MDLALNNLQKLKYHKIQKRMKHKLHQKAMENGKVEFND